MAGSIRLPVFYSWRQLIVKENITYLFFCVRQGAGEVVVGASEVVLLCLGSGRGVWDGQWG